MLGAAGVVLGVTVIWFFAAIPIGVAAVVIGIVARRRVASYHDPRAASRATIATALGCVAILLGVTGAIFLPRVMDRADRFLGSIQQDVNDDVGLVNDGLSADVNRLDRTLTRDLQRFERDNHRDLRELEDRTAATLKALEDRMKGDLDAASAAARRDLDRARDGPARRPGHGPDGPAHREFCRCTTRSRPSRRGLRASSVSSGF